MFTKLTLSDKIKSFSVVDQMTISKGALTWAIMQSIKEIGIWSTAERDLVLAIGVNLKKNTSAIYKHPSLLRYVNN